MIFMKNAISTFENVDPLVLFSYNARADSSRIFIQTQIITY